MRRVTDASSIVSKVAPNVTAGAVETVTSPLLSAMVLQVPRVSVRRPFRVSHMVRVRVRVRVRVYGWG